MLQVKELENESWPKEGERELEKGEARSSEGRSESETRFRCTCARKRVGGFCISSSLLAPPPDGTRLSPHSREKESTRIKRRSNFGSASKIARDRRVLLRPLPE